MTAAVAEDTSYLSFGLRSVTSLYRTVRDFNPVLRKGFELAEAIPTKVVDSQIGKWAYRQQKVLAGYRETALSSLQSKKLFYTSALKSWAQADSVEEFIGHLEGTYGKSWNSSLSQFARQFYNQCCRIPMVDDALYCVAFGLSEGSEHISSAMVAVWRDLRELSMRQYVIGLRDKLGVLWNESLRDRALVFYSIASIDLKSQADRAATSAKELIHRSQVVAEQTSFVVYAAIDSATFWSIDSFDNYFVSFVAPASSEEQHLKGTRKLNSMYSRLKTQISGLVKRETEAISENSLVKRFDSSFGVSSGVASFQNGFSYVTSMSEGDLMEQTWPEDCKLIADRVCNVLHVSCLSTQFTAHVWAKLDQDADGQVTVGDLYMSLKKAREVSPRAALKRLWEKFQAESAPVVVNGQLSS